MMKIIMSLMRTSWIYFHLVKHHYLKHLEIKMMRKSSFSYIINLEERNVDERHYGIDWDTMHDFGMTPLLYAAKSSTIETFQLLLDFGAPCNETVLHFAAGSADEDGEDIVKYLLDEMDSDAMYVQHHLILLYS